MLRLGEETATYFGISACMTTCEHPGIAEIRAAQATLVVKNPPGKAGDVRGVGLIPGSGRFLTGGHDNAVQYSGLENSMDRGAWQATLHGVAESEITEGI